MIKVIFHDEDICRNIFEFIRTQLPSYENKKDMEISIRDNINYLEILISSKEINKTILVKKVEDKRELKFNIKRELYKNLYNYFDNEDPWGILTGVRPVKLVLSLLEKNSIEKTKEILKNYYLLNDDSINLCLDIAKTELSYLYPVNRNRYSLYIHIPICPTKCSYCSFLTLDNNKKNTKIYTDYLIEELKYYSQFVKNPPHTVYIGGGTPTSIDIKELEEIIRTVNIYYKKPLEFTVECGRPDTINKEILLMLKEMGVNRISINPQSMNNKTLKNIGRSHSVEDILLSYDIAKKIGFESINMDLILGLPGESVEDVNYSLNKVISLDPENITIHTLSLKNGSDLYKNKNFSNCNDIDEMLKLTKSLTKKNDYMPYYMYRQKRMLGNGENIGYSKVSKESIYNMVMMEEKETILGFGMCSTSKFYYPEKNKILKTMNYRNLKDYINKNNKVSKSKYINDFKF